MSDFALLGSLERLNEKKEYKIMGINKKINNIIIIL